MIYRLMQYIEKCDKEVQYSKKELGFNADDITFLYELVRFLGKYNRIGIYGTGLHSQRLIKFLLKCGLREKILCFLDESKEEGDFFSFPLKKYISEACEEFRLDIIIISSKLYEQEIYERIRSRVPRNIVLYKIYDRKREAEERVYFVEDQELNIFCRFFLLDAYKAHLNRYGFAMAFVKNKIVLDISCGSGYGSQLLAQRAKKVYGVDIAEDAIKFALKHHLEKNICFINQSIENLILPEKVDIVVSFETIEHVCDSASYFKKILKYLTIDGILIISTPLVQQDGASLNNKFHINEYTLDRFKKELNKYFTEIDYYNQQYNNKGGICIDDGEFSSVEKQHSFIIAVCHR